ncbi:MAG: hypothetical protein H0X47_13925 [Nitrospirales bacterium]|nr:hypothetical protein [Nitrospirales bacterium]
MPASTHILLTGNDVNRRVDAGFRPGSRATFVSAKVAKTIDAPSGLIEEDGR